MSSSKPIFAVMVLMAASALLSACANAPASSSTAPTAQGNGNTNPNATSASDAVAALVNDQSISMDALNHAVDRGIQGIKSVGDPIPSDMTAYRSKILDSLIEQVVIEQAAAIQGVKVSDTDVETELQSLIAIAGSPEKWQQQLAADNMTEAEYRTALRSALITQKMRDIVTASVPIKAEQVHARHILVADEASANDILAKLKSGSDFAQLASQYSLDRTTQASGGDLGWFSRGQLLQKAVEDAAFSLANNQISAPIKSNLGYHIIQTLERVTDRPIDPETRSRLMESTFESWIASLEKGAKIVKFPKGGS